METEEAGVSMYAAVSYLGYSPHRALFLHDCSRRCDTGAAVYRHGAGNVFLLQGNRRLVFFFQGKEDSDDCRRCKSFLLIRNTVLCFLYI